MLKPSLIAILPGLAFSSAWAGSALAGNRLQDNDGALAALRPAIVRFSGEVSRGVSFERKLWPGLVFVLKANDSGWDISVTDGTDRDSDFVRVVTPPYRFDNPRYLGTVYGHSAADAVAWTPRSFSFVTSGADYMRADDAVRKLLWPSGLPETEIGAAEKTLAQVPRGNGVLKITGAKLLAANGWIDSLAFEVEIRPPVDPDPAIRKKFLPEWPEYGTIEETCPGVATPIRIGKTDYHDFDGDGFDEASVLAYSCLVGTGGADLPGVFTRSASGEVVELEIGEIPSGDQKIREGLRGKVDLKVEHGILVKEFPVYRDEDPNCCPTGGARRFSYRWDGQAFVLDKFEDLPAEPNP